jgi:hypothetical protein
MLSSMVEEDCSVFLLGKKYELPVGLLSFVFVLKIFLKGKRLPLD